MSARLGQSQVSDEGAAKAKLQTTMSYWLEIRDAAWVSLRGQGRQGFEP